MLDIIDILEHAVSLHSGGNTNDIELRSKNKKILIDADRTQINRLFTNLFQNAIQSIPDDEEPEIIITVSKDEEMVLVAIQDNGSGIPTETRAKIFTPNFTTKSSGTGLGLAMCKGIVEQSHGNIWFETREGRGTTFFVELPLYKKALAGPLESL